MRPQQSVNCASDGMFDTTKSWHGREPERRLMLAVLEDAFSNYTKYAFSSAPRLARRFRKERAWFEETDDSELFSFESVCGHLKLDSAYIRDRLKAWLEKARQLRSSGVQPVPPQNPPQGIGNAEEREGGIMTIEELGKYSPTYRQLEKKIREQGIPALLVILAAGKRGGLVTRSDIVQMIHVGTAVAMAVGRSLTEMRVLEVRNDDWVIANPELAAQLVGQAQPDGTGPVNPSAPAPSRPVPPALAHAQPAGSSVAPLSASASGQPVQTSHTPTAPRPVLPPAPPSSPSSPSSPCPVDLASTAEHAAPPKCGHCLLRDADSWNTIDTGFCFPCYCGLSGFWRGSRGNNRGKAFTAEEIEAFNKDHPYVPRGGYHRGAQRSAPKCPPPGATANASDGDGSSPPTTTPPAPSTHVQELERTITRLNDDVCRLTSELETARHDLALARASSVDKERLASENAALHQRLQAMKALVRGINRNAGKVVADTTRLQAKIGLADEEVPFVEADDGDTQATHRGGAYGCASALERR